MFDLTGNNFITRDDLAQMIINLPLDAIVVEHSPQQKGGGTAIMSTDFLSNINIEKSHSNLSNGCCYSLIQAPTSSEGIRRKRKFLTPVKDSKVNQMVFQFLLPQKCREICETMMEYVLEGKKQDPNKGLNLSFPEFRKWLDMNPYIRFVVLAAVSP